MHPIERLRYVARASGVDPAILVRETAGALAAVVRVEPAGLVPACRRLIERHLTTGPVWWLAARVLTAADPGDAAWAAAEEIEDDTTAAALAGALPDDATVTIVGWPETAAGALRRRGDLEVLIGDAMGEGDALCRRLAECGTTATVIPDAGLAAAAVVSHLVVIEAVAGGPTGVLATCGSHAVAAVGAHAGLPVWAVAPVGRILPDRLWDALLKRLDNGQQEPWDRAVELVPASLFTEIVGPDGPVQSADGLGRATCPVAPELLRPAG
jgi:hypothetical protein